LIVWADKFDAKGLWFDPNETASVRKSGETEPSDMSEPIRVGERNLECSGDVETVRPVFGEASSGQRDRAEWCRSPCDRKVWIGSVQRRKTG
jgi:hypothetical protein